ncbi:[Fe-Fe] hydrogenase large subunit C-terminal domain-containing protein [Orenia marismortui]|uniref:Iron only hydrogenase large subunit-like protein n=1 Tax=Orenia marismortui TaxID=46469 RepID=A0A4R8GSU3_9FIRM|nr:[Fe-Fe] hydrogenase large subunit C-terminal domain-containing protein [Orenia marismortui]TDX49028.1 iron only hydrogenase large subunit-like protein [Orenia marismortui]
MSDIHSVLLKADKCKGCTNCVKNCPTNAIRVHQGQAKIKDEYCIDCGECIRSCEYHAKYASTDRIEEIDDYKYPIALVPPSFYGQFTQNINPTKVILALQELGFYQVWDVALGAEVITAVTKEYLKNNNIPIISSSCPAVVRLVQLLYPELLNYLAPFKSPVEVTAQKAREFIKENEKVKDEEIGIFFITPCPAKMTTVDNPLAMEKSYLDKAIAVDEIYHELIKRVEDIDGYKEIENYNIPYFGISWASNGGEANLLTDINTVSVSGIHNVMSVLEELDRGDLSHIRYFEMVACQPGCVGGVLNIKNPFLAEFNIQNLIKEGVEFVKQDITDYDIKLPMNFKEKSIGSLDDDLIAAMAKLTKLEEEIELLPGLDCAACGAPDCRTLAEDIVNGWANRTDCIFILRQQVADLADEMATLAHALPPVMKRKKEGDDIDED